MYPDGKCSGVKSPSSSSLKWTRPAWEEPLSHTMVALSCGNTNQPQVGVHSNSGGFETVPLEKHTRLVNVQGGTGELLRMST